MAGFFGFDDTPAEPAPEPTPPREPRAPRKSRKPRADKAQAAAPQPDPAADRAAASAKVAQDAQLERQARELADLAERVTRAGAVQGPESTTEKPAASPVDFVVERWNRYGDTVNAARLGLPAGSILRARAWGETGVEVRVRVPAGTVLLPVADALAANCLAWGWGEYAKGADTAKSFILRRAIIGEDPATPWRAAGRTAYAVYANDPRHVRGLLWENAGLTMKQADGTVLAPTIRDMRVGDRGPELLLRLPGGLPVDAAARTAPTFASLFRCPELVAVAEGSDLRIRLNTKPAPDFPPVVTMSPSQFWLPRTQELRYVAAPKLLLPVGVTRTGERVEVALAKRPHTIIAGQSGSGKTRTVMSMITGLALGGSAIAIGDFKGDPALADLYGKMPGVVHHSTTLGGISRLVLWAYDELARRSALLPLLARKGITAPVWEPVVIILDEWGQGLDELLNAPEAENRGAGAALVNMMSKIFAQGRSFGLHVILSTQHVYASAIPGRIAQNAANRIIIGKPKAGPKGHIVGLFQDDREAAEGAAEGITDGMQGRGIIADQAGRVVQFQAHYGYTPAEPPESVSGELRESWEATRDALHLTPRLRRWGWRFPLDGTGEWQAWSLFPGDKSTGPLPTVRDLDVVVLDGLDGRPDPTSAKWDPLSVEYAPGAPLLNPGHAAPTNRNLN